MWSDLRPRGPKSTRHPQGQCVSAILEQRGQGAAVLVYSAPPPLLPGFGLIYTVFQSNFVQCEIIRQINEIHT